MLKDNPLDLQSADVAESFLTSIRIEEAMSDIGENGVFIEQEMGPSLVEMGSIPSQQFRRGSLVSPHQTREQGVVSCLPPGEGEERPAEENTDLIRSGDAMMPEPPVEDRSMPTDDFLKEGFINADEFCEECVECEQPWEEKPNSTEEPLEDEFISAEPFLDEERAPCSCRATQIEWTKDTPSVVLEDTEQSNVAVPSQGLSLQTSSLPPTSPILLPLQHSSSTYFRSIINADVKNLLPSMVFDEWSALFQEIRKNNIAQIDTQLKTIWSKTIGCCEFIVACKTTVVKLKKLKTNNNGSTEYIAKAEIDRGTFTNLAGGGGSFVRITINILIKLNLSKVGKEWVESNKKVKEERENAGKKSGFGKLPLEFILIHELMHRDDICKELSDIAKKALAFTAWKALAGIDCNFTVLEEKTLQTDLSKKWQEILKVDKGRQSQLEEKIRRGAWAEWDKRHP